MILLYIVLASLTVSLISLIGIIFFGLKLDVRKITFYLISFASGTLLSAAFLHLLPESVEANHETACLRIAIGVLIFFVLEKFLIWRHCHGHQRPEDHSKPVAANMVLIGDAVHNFIDGVIIASAFMTDIHVGVSVTIAILLHEIPQELGDFGILIHGGYSMKNALIANLLIGTTAMAGAVLTYFIFGTSAIVQTSVLPIATGGLLYISLADLIPQLHEHTSKKETILQIILLFLGFGLIAALGHHR